MSDNFQDTVDHASDNNSSDQRITNIQHFLRAISSKYVKVKPVTRGHLLGYMSKLHFLWAKMYFNIEKYLWRGDTCHVGTLIEVSPSHRFYLQCPCEEKTRPINKYSKTGLQGTQWSGATLWSGDTQWSGDTLWSGATQWSGDTFSKWCPIFPMLRNPWRRDTRHVGTLSFGFYCMDVQVSLQGMEECIYNRNE